MKISEIKPGVAAQGFEQIRAVNRAISELRQGGFVLLRAECDEVALVQAAEAVTDGGLLHLRQSSGSDPVLVLTGRRGLALGLGSAWEPEQRPETITLALADMSAMDIRDLVNPLQRPGATDSAAHLAYHVPQRLMSAAITLSKLAQLLPAVILAPLERTWFQNFRTGSVLSLDVAVVDEYQAAAAYSLQPVAEAEVPLMGVGAARVVAFRPADGRFEHLAIVVGDLQPSRPVLTRVHSQCFTGDLLGSLRCDCGDQLRGAIQAIAHAGSGILLYLAQEGRGIGLANKLRAYNLQDQGVDTASANELLGFDADERNYLPAVEMLRHFSIGRVRLLTNNPGKVAALVRHGIVVEERLPIAVPANAHNQDYLATKVARFGHLI